MRWPRLIAVAVATFSMLSACGSDGEPSAGQNDERIEVVTSLAVIADFIREVGGERLSVTALLPLGADPHTFEPSPRDAERVAAARIGFVNGLGVDESALDIIRENLPDGSPLVELGTRLVGAGAGGHGGDPHLWMDTQNGIAYAAFVRDALSAIDPEGAASYQAGHERFADSIAGAETYVRERIEAIPEASRRLVTTHDAFGHFAGRFGLQVAEFVVDSPGQDASPEDVADLARVLDGQGVPAVFAEPQISSETEILRRAAGDAGVQVCTLYSDSLDDRVTGYVEMMRFNADELALCLGGADDR